MTHDEALTYKIIRGDEILKGTANHHWLNTQLSALSSYIFGAKELILRLPNILSFAVFWLFLFRISRYFLKSSFSQIALLLFLCGNPFILDFFSLCRGYGLSIAFVTASLFYLFRIVDLKRDSKPIHYYLAAIFSILALSANLNTLNYFLIAVALIILSMVVFKPKHWISLLLVLLILSGISLYFSLDRLFFLKDQNELYFGTGELTISVENLLHSSFYKINRFAEVIVLRYALYILLIISGILVIRKKQFFNVGTIAFLILVTIVIALVAENSLFDALYPVNRSSLYLYPIVLLSFLLNLDAWKIRIVPPVIALCSVLFILFNLNSYNLRKTMTWLEDQDIKEAMLIIKNDIPDKTIHLVECRWIYEPMINYYRLEYDIPVQEVFRDDLKFQAEYLFTNTFSENDWTQLNAFHLIFKNNESGLMVYKRKSTAAN